MPTYYVTVDRPTVDAATPEEAASTAVTTPLEADDKVFVREVDPSGSLQRVPGATRILGGTSPPADLVIEGSTTTKEE